MDINMQLEKTLKDLGETFDQSVTEPFYQQESAEIIRYMMFELNNELYGWPLAYICEVVSDNKIIPIPGKHPYLIGITNYRNQVLSVIDLYSLLGLTKTNSNVKKVTLLVTKNLQINTTLCIEKLVGILSVKAQDVVPSIPSINKGVAKYLLGEIYHEERLVTFFNPIEIAG